MLAGNDGDMMSVKYGDIKVIFRYCNGHRRAIVKPMFPLVFDLSSDPGEEFNLMYEKLDMMWMFEPAIKVLTEYKRSLLKYPNIKPGDDFEGYKGVKEQEGEPTVAEYEHYHHAPG